MFCSQKVITWTTDVMKLCAGTSTTVVVIEGDGGGGDEQMDDN